MHRVSGCIFDTQLIKVKVINHPESPRTSQPCFSCDTSFHLRPTRVISQLPLPSMEAVDMFKEEADEVKQPACFCYA